jgi:hypothetical protein
MKWRVSKCDWPDPVKPLHEITDGALEELIESAKSEQLRRVSFPERCNSFKLGTGRCLKTNNPCIPGGDCWRDK